MKIIDIILNDILNLFNLNNNFLVIFILIIKNIILIIFITYYLLNVNFEFAIINNNIIKIVIDNEYQYSVFENDLTFDNYSSILKPIAIYNPQIIDINNNNYNSNNENFINKTVLLTRIRNSVNLAKHHGINYKNDNNMEIILNQEIDIFLMNEYINFPFFLIWKNQNFFDLINKIKKQFDCYNKLIEIELDKFVKNIKK